MEDNNLTHITNNFKDMHPWNKLPHITDDTVSMLIDKIKTKEFTPRKVFDFIKDSDQYLICKQLRTIQLECSELYSNYRTWYLYDHALCSRVTDPWNLTPKYGAEGYYYCSIIRANKLPEPPYKWNAMELEEPFF